MPTFTLSRRHALVAVACAIGIVLVASRLLGGPESPASERAVPLVATPVAKVPGRRKVTVDVEGAVRRPGVYHLPADARIADAIARAGGATRRADKMLVNLAARLADGEQVLVPVRGHGLHASAGGAATAAPVDLNSATVEQLDALPGVGPVTAQKIVDYRREHGPFTSIDQLDAISGIGPTRIDNLRGLVVP